VLLHANKIFNLRKGLPISAMTWGLGSIGGATISTLAKDLRRRFTGEAAEHKDWHLDPASYTVAEIADRFKTFFYEEHYEPFIEASGAQQLDGAARNAAGLGLLMAGYGAGQNHPEAHAFWLSPDGCTGPVPILADDTGASWWVSPRPSPGCLGV
jgi:hypothetical protein